MKTESVIMIQLTILTIAVCLGMAGIVVALREIAAKL